MSITTHSIDTEGPETRVHAGQPTRKFEKIWWIEDTDAMIGIEKLTKTIKVGKNRK